jgi:hypothetical protein
MASIAATPQVPDALQPADAMVAAPQAPTQQRAEPAPVTPMRRPDRASRPSRVVWLGLAAAAAIVLVLGGWNLSLQRQASDADRQLALVRQAVAAASDPTSTVAPLAGTDAAPGASGVVVIPATGTGYLMIQGLPALADDRVYQAWYLAGGTPTSAGLMEPSSAGVTVLAGLQPVPGTDTIALTVEPAGGMPSPSGAIVIMGTLPA